MPAQIFGAQAAVSMLNRAFANTSPGNAVFNNQVANATSLLAPGADSSSVLSYTAFAKNFGANYASQTAAQLSTLLMTNMGLLPNAALETALADYITANGGPANVGIVALQLSSILSSLEGNAQYGAAALAWNNEVTTAFTYSSNSANTNSSTGDQSVNAGQTYTLTTGADNVAGSSGNDVVNAAISSGSMTFDALDSIAGGAGNDTLNISGNANGTYQASVLTDVETINLNSSAATATVSLLGATGVTTVANSGSTAAAAFTNIASTSVGLQVKNSTANTSFGFTAAAVAGTSDTATLTLNNAGGTHTIAGVETLNIVSSGAANSVTLTTAAATRYVITGDQALTLGGTLAAATRTVDASAATGALTVTIDPAAGAGATVNGGSANDSITVTGTNAANDSINAGAGNDTVVYSANLATTDTINGGDGTDILASTSALLTGYTAPATATITNFETIRVTDALGAALTAANVQATGITTVDLAGGTGTFTVTMAAGDMNVRVGAANTGVLTLTDTGTATTDTMTLTNTAAATNVFNGQNLAVNGYETITINGTGTGAATAQTLGSITSTADVGGTATVKFAGSNSFTTGVITATTVDASGLTGAAVFSNTGAATVGVTSIIGSANGDTLVGSATATNINGGAGNDTITGGAANDTLVGGDGADSITAAAGNDSIDAGAGNDVIVLGANLASGDVINGGDGTDTLSITDASVTAVNALSISAINSLNNALTNLEKVTISDQLTQSLDIARIKSLADITLAAGATTSTLSGLAANTTITNTGAVTSLTLGLADATGTADVVNVVLSNAADTTVGTLATSGIETVNINVTESPANATVRVNTITTATLTGATKLVVTGTENLTITNNIGVATIDASANTGGFVMTGAATGSSMTISGSTAADNITGGVAADNITGGAGADTILGGAGADTISGGTGGDSITGGTGNDTISLGAADGATDRVVFGTAASTNVDTISEFTVGATNGDILNLAGVAALLNTGTTAILNVTTTTTAGAANDNVLALNFGSYYADASAVAAALASGGAITIGSGIAGAADNAIVLYQASAGGDVRVAMANVANAGGFTAVTDVAVLVGVTNVTSLVTANLTV